MSSFSKILESLDIPNDLGASLDRFADLFLRWNASINLSAARTKAEVSEHIEDSLRAVAFIRSQGVAVVDPSIAVADPSIAVADPSSAVPSGEPLDVGSGEPLDVGSGESLDPIVGVGKSLDIGSASGQSLIDVGSGGGLPAVVIAICCPEMRVVALEPVHKKHAFLKTAARELGLTNFEAHARRVEDHPDRNYDFASSRATFDLREWLALGLTLVRPGGRVLGFEGIERTDLPETAKRYSYALAGKQRAIVSVERPL